MTTELLRFTDAGVDPLWHHLDLAIPEGEFLTVLGPNGVGKSTLLNVLLGRRSLTSGSLRRQCRMGFIPQQRMFPADLPLRARDLVSLSAAHGVVRGRRPAKGQVEELLAAVGADGLADHRVGTLSGGQQQLIRQAQALANDPQLILADEPLLSLDIAAQSHAVDMLDARRHSHGTSVIFVTHGINPVLRVTDRVLYIAPTGHVLGTVEEVMNSETLSELYNTKVTVAEVEGRLVVI